MGKNSFTVPSNTKPFVFIVQKHADSEAVRIAESTQRATTPNSRENARNRNGVMGVVLVCAMCLSIIYKLHVKALLIRLDNPLPNHHIHILLASSIEPGDIYIFSRKVVGETRRTSKSVSSHSKQIQMVLHSMRWYQLHNTGSLYSETV